jgi:mRNA interferase MazF
MKTGDIVLIPFPFAELTNIKARPAVIICLTKDKYQDIIIAAISSVIPAILSDNEMTISPNSHNKLKVQSVVKIDRLATLKQSDIIAPLGQLNTSEIAIFRTVFKSLID